MITVIGKASGREQTLPYAETDLSRNLLDWLRSKGITIASSCDGEGVCKKCDIQNGWLTCQMTLAEFLGREQLGRIEVAYL